MMSSMRAYHQNNRFTRKEVAPDKIKAWSAYLAVHPVQSILLDKYKSLEEKSMKRLYVILSVLMAASMILTACGLPRLQHLPLPLL